MFKRFLYIVKSTSMERSLIHVLVCSFVILSLEAISLGAIAPIIFVLVDIQNIENQTFSWVFSSLEIIELNTKILLLITITFSIYLFKFLMLLFTTKFLEKKVNEFLEKIEILIYNKFIKQPFLSFIENKSSDFIKLFQIELSYFYFFLKAVLVLISESLFLFIILLFFFFFEPLIVTIGVLVFFGMFLFKYFFSNKTIDEIGKKRQKLDKEISSVLDESIRGFKEIRLENKSSYYNELLSSFIKNKREQVILGVYKNVTPKFYFEFISVVLLLIISGYFTILKNDPNIVLKIGLIVAITFKTIPSLNKILVSLQSIKFRKESINEIYSFLNQFSNEQNKSLIARVDKFKSLSIRSLCIQYENNIVFENATLEISKNQKIGIYGPSGSGKSTLVNFLSGLINERSSEIKYNGDKLKSIRQISNRIGYVPQNVFISNNSMCFNITYGTDSSKSLDLKKLNEIIDLCELRDVCNEKEIFTKKLGDSGSKLSGGQIQRIGIARSLYKDCEILILDESTSALDKKTEEKLLNLLYSLNKTIIFISHELKVLNRCHKILLIRNKNFEKL